MAATTLFESRLLSVIDYRCTASSADRPFAESHERYSLAYVRKGSFGCRAHGEAFDLVTGSLMVGYPGDEYVCTHEQHHGGDECLSFQLAPELVDTLGGTAAPWVAGAVPPDAGLVVVRQLGQANGHWTGELR